MIFPKDCILCDVCNAEITDNTFIANQDCFWFKDWLYCNNCNEKYNPKSELELIMEIKKDNDLSNSDLAKPIIITPIEKTDDNNLV